jgi:competence protein ComEC
MNSKTRKIVYSVLIILFLAAILIWSEIFKQAPTGFLKVEFFNVGQGDSIFLETPEHYQVLIDGGPDASVLEKLGTVMPFWDREIDLVILTHPDYDHITGLIEVLKNYSVRQIIANNSSGAEAGESVNDENYLAWQKLIKEKNIPVIVAKAGQNIKIGDRAELKIFWPNDLAQDNTNDNSIVSQLVFGQSEFFLEADISNGPEIILAQSEINLSSDVLKVSHHGSKNSSNPLFLEKINPKIAIISVGKNKYGHPAPETLDKLKEVQLFRTDQNGDIVCLTNGVDLSCKGY